MAKHVICDDLFNCVKIHFQDILNFSKIYTQLSSNIDLQAFVTTKNVSMETANIIYLAES